MIVLVEGQLLLEQRVECSLVGQSCLGLGQTFSILNEIKLDICDCRGLG